MHHRPASRGFFLGASLLLSLLATGCASIKDPVVAGERHSQVVAVPLQKVLVVVDYRLEVRATGATGRRAEFMDATYKSFGDVVGEAVTASGGQPTVVYVRHDDELPTAGADYSHVWVQRVHRLRGVTQGGITRGESREWRSSIAHRTAPGAALLPAYEMDYQSDAVMCWTMTVYANKEECRTRIRAFVAGQVQKYLAAR